MNVSVIVKVSMQKYRFPVHCHSSNTENRYFSSNCFSLQDYLSLRNVNFPTSSFREYACADNSSLVAEDSSAEESQSTLPYVQYVNTTTVTITLQGQEAQIRELLDDIAKNYPGIQVRSFDMQSGTYVDSSLQKTEQMNCNCVLAVYTCGELSNTKGE